MEGYRKGVKPCPTCGENMPHVNTLVDGLFDSEEFNYDEVKSLYAWHWCQSCGSMVVVDKVFQPKRKQWLS